MKPLVLDSLHLFLGLGLIAACVAAYLCWRELSALRLGLATSQRKEADASRALHALEVEYAGALARLERTAALEAEEDRLSRDLGAAQSSLAALEAQMRTREEAMLAREQQWAQSQAQTREAFEALASDVLQKSQTSFLNLANETFAKSQVQANSTLDGLMKPIAETFNEFKERVNAVQRDQADVRAAIEANVKGIGDQLQRNTEATQKLALALRGNPQARGRWGEEQLRNIVELAGLSKFADFDEQKSSQGADGGQSRPDMIVRLPGGRAIVIDAKVALENYLEAVEASDDTLRGQALDRHAAQMRKHALSLGRKEYWKTVVAESADFVAMFVPGENFYAAAVERDPTLHQDALRQNVVIVTPATLLALLKVIAYGWRQEESARNAAEVARLGAELYDRLAGLGDRMAAMGKSIDQSVKSYNELAGTLERRVLPQARKFVELEAASGRAALPEVKALESDTRPLSGKDLLLGVEPSAGAA